MPRISLILYVLFLLRSDELYSFRVKDGYLGMQQYPYEINQEKKRIARNFLSQSTIIPPLIQEGIGISLGIKLFLLAGVIF